MQAQATQELALLRGDLAAGQDASHGLQEQLGHAQTR